MTAVLRALVSMAAYIYRVPKAYPAIVTPAPGEPNIYGHMDLVQS